MIDMNELIKCHSEIYYNMKYALKSNNLYQIVRVKLSYDCLL